WLPQAGNGSKPGSITSGPGSTGSRVGAGDTPGGPFSGSGSGSGNLGSGSFGGSLIDEDGTGAGRRLSSSGSVAPGPGKGGPGKRSDGCWGMLILLRNWFAGFVANLFCWWLRLKHDREDELPWHHDFLCGPVGPFLLAAV